MAQSSKASPSGEKQSMPNQRGLRWGLNQLSRLLAVIERFVIAYGILAIATVTVVNVFFRVLLDNSLTFAEELSEIGIIWVTFLGVSYAARQGRHIRMSALYDALSDRWRKYFMIGISLITGVLMLFFAYFSLLYVQDVYQSERVTSALRLPVFWIYLPVPFGLFLTGIQYFLTIVKNLQEKEVYLSFEKKDEFDDEVPAPGME